MRLEDETNLVRACTLSMQKAFLDGVGAGSKCVCGEVNETCKNTHYQHCKR